jgi:hypothetical protein
VTFVIAYHGHCFDGMASAAFFSRFLRHRAGGPVEIETHGLDHQPGGSHVPEAVLTGRDNAVVDFRYTRSPRLTWYFDHHESGVHEDERDHLLADTSDQKHWDPTYGSCCLLLEDVLRDRFDFEAPELDGLVRWAQMIDTAGFPDAETAVRLEEPPLRLMAVVDVFGDDAFLAPRIERLSRGVPLEEIAQDHVVSRRFRKVQREQELALRLVESRARCEAGVVTFDLAGQSERYNRFTPYYLFPESRYAVAVTQSPRRVKISVGSNPWAKAPRTHDIAALCARFGGGGHPVVGAVSLGPTELQRGREVAAAIAGALRQG